MIVPAADWEPSFPPEYHVADIGDQIHLSTESREGLERLIEWLSDVEDISVRIEGVGDVEFPLEPERFYVLYDSPSIGFAIDEAARRLNVDLVSNVEPLSEHAPRLADRVRS